MSTTNNNTSSGSLAGPVTVIGGRGMLGSMFVDLLTHRGLVVHAVDQQEMDITDAAQVEQGIRAMQPRYIINCAAYTNVDGAEENEALATRINSDGVAYIAAAAKTVGARIVHFSTDYVFDGENPEGYAEDATPNPINAYGRSKRAGEQALQNSGADFLLIRTAWLYGPKGKNFVDTMRQKMESGEALRVVGDQIGCPTYTYDLVQATHALLAMQAAPGVYHLVNSGSTSWYGFAQKIQELLGTHAPLTEVPTSAFPRPAVRPRYSILQSTQANPLPRWEDALQRYISI